MLFSSQVEFGTWESILPMQMAKAMRRTAKMDHCTTPKTRTNTHMFWACFLTTEIRIIIYNTCIHLAPSCY